MYFFRPLASRRKGAECGVPILMYHSISEASEKGHPYFHTRTSPARFARQMRFLREGGYSTLALRDLPRIFSGQLSEISKPVVITFDDGYRDFFTHAFPKLDENGFTATMFLPSSFVGVPRLRLNQIECMTWEEVRELDRAGIEFGSHTVTHPQLASLPSREVEAELRVSKEVIENRIGKPVTCFSYPYAFPETDGPFVELLKNTLVGCGYRIGVSTIIGTAAPNDRLFCLRRLPVNSADDLPLFQAKLEGGYDWLHGLQRLKKTIHRMVAV